LIRTSARPGNLCTTFRAELLSAAREMVILSDLIVFKEFLLFFQAIFSGTMDFFLVHHFPGISSSAASAGRPLFCASTDSLASVFHPPLADP
jgi:hypothetical protein